MAKIPLKKGFLGPIYGSDGYFLRPNIVPRGEIGSDFRIKKMVFKPAKIENLGDSTAARRRADTSKRRRHKPSNKLQFYRLNPSSSEQ